MTGIKRAIIVTVHGFAKERQDESAAGNSRAVSCSSSSFSSSSSSPPPVSLKRADHLDDFDARDSARLTVSSRGKRRRPHISHGIYSRVAYLAVFGKTKARRRTRRKCTRCKLSFTLRLDAVIGGDLHAESREHWRPSGEGRRANLSSIKCIVFGSDRMLHYLRAASTRQSPRRRRLLDRSARTSLQNCRSFGQHSCVPESILARAVYRSGGGRGGGHTVSTAGISIALKNSE